MNNVFCFHRPCYCDSLWYWTWDLLAWWEIVKDGEQACRQSFIRKALHPGEEADRHKRSAGLLTKKKWDFMKGGHSGLMSRNCHWPQAQFQRCFLFHANISALRNGGQLITGPVIFIPSIPPPTQITWPCKDRSLQLLWEHMVVEALVLVMTVVVYSGRKHKLYF